MFTRRDGRDRHTSLIALLVLLTLLPAACVLWFMNEALEVQSDAVRRSMLEGYRAQLRLVRSRVEAHWQAHAAQINGSGDARRRFFQLIDGDMGDGAILLDEYGRIAFPDRDARATSVAQTIAGELATAEQMPAGQARQERVRTIAGELNDYERPLGADTRVP